MRTNSLVSVTGLCLVGVFAAGFFTRSLVANMTGSSIRTVQAQDDRDNERPRRCSTRTLKGAYGIKFDGQKINTGPFVSVARITFDGAGQFSTNETGRFNGNPIQRAFTGPYTVNDDCTGFLDFSSDITNPPHHAHGDFVIVDEGKQFFIVDNEEGWAASGVGRKL
ncbi:MAG: hypothetical protein M3R69_09665 [Acidobacteriota bacterium]|nr:hypothetical protein [Acidobacteriota bacterium]